MEKITDQADRPSCPTCGLAATRRHTIELDGVATAYYLCDRDHGWLVRWVMA